MLDRITYNNQRERVFRDWILTSADKSSTMLTSCVIRHIHYIRHTHHIYTGTYSMLWEHGLRV